MTFSLPVTLDPHPSPHSHHHPSSVTLLTAQKTLSSSNFLRGDKFSPDQFGYNTASLASSASYRGPTTGGSRGRTSSTTSAAMGDYTVYPEGRPVFLPEAERFGNPPDLPSLLLQQRIIYISMPVSSQLDVLSCGCASMSRTNFISVAQEGNLPWKFQCSCLLSASSIVQSSGGVGDDAPPAFASQSFPVLMSNANAVLPSDILNLHLLSTQPVLALGAMKPVFLATCVTGKPWLEQGLLRLSSTS